MRLFSRPDKSILVVCTANICRSPMAEAVFKAELLQRGLGDSVRVDSAGTHAAQPGRGADPRAQRICADRGINLARSRARQVREEDFSRFDHVLAVDRRNREWLLEHSPRDLRERISLLSSWAPSELPEDIPDPYYGNMAGFDEVLSLLQASIRGFVGHLRG